MTQSKDGTLPSNPSQILRDVLAHRGWDVRDGQMQMVEAIESLAHENEGLDGVCVQAPVGTGKTLGYLIGAIVQAGRIIVCTSTKALQDQIVTSELPRLSQDLYDLYGYVLPWSVMKGKSNYVCLEEMRNATSDGPIKGDVEDLLNLVDEDKVHLREVYNSVLEGMLDGQVDVVENASVREIAVSIGMDRDSEGLKAITHNLGCQNRSRTWNVDEDCPENNLAHVQEASCAEETACAWRWAYQKALTAKIVVVNTSLYAAELVRSSAIADWAPMAPQLVVGGDFVIVDEAHHMVKILMESLSNELDVYDAIYAVNKVSKRIKMKRASDMIAEISEALQSLDETMLDAWNKGDDEVQLVSRQVVTDVIAPALEEAQAMIDTTLKGAIGVLLAQKSKGKIPVEEIEKWVSSIRALQGDDLLAQIDAMVEKCDNEDYVSYLKTFTVESTGAMVTHLKVAPLDVSFVHGQWSRLASMTNGLLNPPSPEYDEYERHEASSTFNPTVYKPRMVLCSGTLPLTVDQSIGLTKSHRLVADSPFKPNQIRVCIPEGLPEPSDRSYDAEAWAAAKLAIRAAGGRTLFLTTSYRKLDHFAEMARSEMTEFRILTQRDRMTRSELMEVFKNDESSVLFGTTSYWEGIDIPGPALSLVIIDKTPFPIMTDPIVQARRMFFRERVEGANPFMKVDVDHAATMLAQGAGRLIRSETDTGGILILDPRIVEKKYGKQLLALIPANFPFTRDLHLFAEHLKGFVENEPIRPRTEQGWRHLRPKRPSRHR